MQSTTMRISASSKRIVEKLAKKEGKSLQTILDQAIKHYVKDRFVEEMDEFSTVEDQPSERIGKKDRIKKSLLPLQLSVGIAENGLSIKWKRPLDSYEREDEI